MATGAACVERKFGRVKLAVGVLTRNIYEHDRVDIFRRTVRSLASQMPEGSDLFIVSNGSTDGTAEYVASLGGTVVDDPISTHGHGANVVIGICAAALPDIIVFSNDDIEWKPGALRAVAEMWAAAPADLGIIGGLLEPEFPWNAISGRIELAGRAGLVRETVPAAAWTFRTSTWEQMRPLPESPGWDDVPTCHRLIRKGFRLAQFDLVEHLGEGASTWGNDAARHGTPLDKAAWGIP